MERAADYAPFPKEFPVALSAPVWLYHQLQYAMSGAYATTGVSPTTTAKTGGGDGFQQAPPPKTTLPSPTTAPAPAPPPPPPTTTAPAPNPAP
jgi:hypothetical protein